MILLVATIIPFFAGCSLPNCSLDQTDRSPFIGIPCEAPCWQGLTIGKSTESEVISKLSTLTFIDQDLIYFHRMSMPSLDPYIYGPGVEITASCICPRKKCLTISVVNNVFIDAEIVLNYKIDLSEAIRYLGEPDYISYHMMGAEIVTCEIRLIWQKRQLILVSDTFHISEIEKNCGVVRDTGKTVSSLQISRVRYVTPGEIDFLLIPSETLFKYSGALSGE